MSAYNEYIPNTTTAKVQSQNANVSLCLKYPSNPRNAFPWTARVNSLLQGTAPSRGPSPNRGASVQDFTAIGPESESKQEWLKRNNIDVSKRVKITKVSHMRYQHPDLNQITTFLRGMYEPIYRATFVRP